MLDERILRELRAITDEEQTILDGQSTIDRSLYMQSQLNVVNSKKLLSGGKLITLRPNTRFVHFPEHTHDYVEMAYGCSGVVEHIVDGKSIRLKPGDLLFLGQKAAHQVCPAGWDDIAVNFIILPEFFSDTLSAISQEATVLRQFLVDCLFRQNIGPSYLHFQVADDRPIQNLAENLLITLLHDTPNRRKVSQMTMTLLFLQLLSHTDKLDWDDREDSILKLLRYVEDRFVSASLTEAAELIRTDVYTLSRLIRRQTGKTFTQLVQEKRLAQAAFLLTSTRRNVGDVARAVGYENISYFHRIFKAAYGLSPRQYRLAK
ncbi:MAG: AraC family transcriptional regulator [Oscillospiraceae bacterium]|nr:AraC family transcriptional regulator [Oscillospiraceae bacterium]